MDWITDVIDKVFDEEDLNEYIHSNDNDGEPDNVFG